MQQTECPEVKGRLSEGNRRGQLLRCSRREEKDITMVIGANEVVYTYWNTVDVTRPLFTVRQICLQGSRVLFGAKGGVMCNIENGHEPVRCRGQRLSP